MHTSDEGFCIIKKFEGLPVNDEVKQLHINVQQAFGQ